MKTYLIVTITCPDRPGIVERITDAMSGYSANWEDSRMARLGGDFAGIVKISVSPPQAEPLTRSLQGLADEHTAILVKTSEAAPATMAGGDRLCHLHLAGADHEGIVHKVSSYLASQNINVETMETGIVPAPMSAAPVFQMEATIKVPASLELATLAANLGEIGDQLGVDITVEPEH